MSVPALRAAIGGLALTMMIGWGSTYYVPAVLAPVLRSDLGLSEEAVFGGVTIMLLVAAAVAPMAGRIMERRGARGTLVLGSVMMALALVGLAFARGMWSYLLVWVLVGAATPLALTQAAVTAVAERAPGDARRAVSTLLLLSGFSSTIFWPLTTWLAAHLGWRGTCLVFAGLHLVVCATIHGFLLGRPQGRGSVPKYKSAAAPDAMIPAAKERGAFLLTALALSLAGFVSWGLPLQAVAILTSFGHSLETAVWVAALMGPAQVLARVGEVAFGQRAGILNVGLASAGLMPLAVLFPMAADHSVSAAVLFIVGYGISAGAMTIVRSVLPLALFGRERYARLIGQLSLPQNAAFALSPVIFASVMRAWGPTAVLMLSLAVSLVAAAAMAGLSIAVRKAAEI
jgi:MFS family permease